MSRVKRDDTIKFVLLSLCGILLFFVPVIHSTVPVVYGINAIKNLAGDYIKYVVIVSSILLLCSLIGGRVLGIAWMKEYHQGDSSVKIGFFAASILLVGMVYLDVDLPFIRNPEIGGKILMMASTIFITIALAGTLVIFIIKSGIVEAVSILMEPVMRPVFKLPGEAAINMISSFVSSASVGVYFTEQYYEKNTYTTRQACAVVTNFSVVSVGYIGVLASIAGIEQMYGTLLIGSFVIVLVMAAIMVRIPPLSRMDNLCMNGESQNHVSLKLGARERLRQALQVGTEKSQEFTPEAFKSNFLQAFKFAQKTVGVMIPTVMFVMVIAYDTPFFQWLGYPLVPLIRLLGIPDAVAIAPSVLIGIVEISLPSILVAGGRVAAQSVYFIVQLSIVQIIFFSEAGNAILSSKIPLKAGKLVLIFLVRTAVAMPIVAMLSHILF